MKRKYVVVLAGLSFCLPAVFFYFRQEGSDHVLYPDPALVLLTMLFGLRWAAFAVPTVSFFVWNQGYFEVQALSRDGQTFC
jgi:hypothetical protein